MQLTWAVSLPLDCHHSHLPLTILLLLSPKADAQFYRPTEGRRLSWGIAGRVLQPVPKTAYHNDCHDECHRRCAWYKPGFSHATTRCITTTPLWPAVLQAYLHSRDIIHRDLNSHNCLIKEVSADGLHWLSWHLFACTTKYISWHMSATCRYDHTASCLGPLHGAIAVPSVTHCRCRCHRCRGHRCAGGTRQYR